MLRFAVALAALLLRPAAASAQRVQDTFFNSVIPSRIDHLIGFSTTTFAIHPPGQRVVPIKVRVGGRTYRYIFGNAAAVVGPSAKLYLRNMIRQRRYPSPEGISSTGGSAVPSVATSGCRPTSPAMPMSSS